MACSKVCGAVAPFLEYDTVKTVHIRSQKVGMIFRLLQLGILGYIIGYVIVYKKGYQELDQAVSSITTKVDYIIPAQENNALFILTNSVQISGQYQRAAGWNEDTNITVKNVSGINNARFCLSNADCPLYDMSRNGVLNGICNTSTSICDIYAWGPVETNALDAEQEQGAYNLLPQAENFSIFVKNNIYFPKFNQKTQMMQFTNVPPGQQNSDCSWNPSSNPTCPFFRLGDIMKLAGIPNFAQNEIATGAVVTIGMQYTCDLDKSSSCSPDITVTRTDDPTSSSVGYNFRFAYFTTDRATQVVYRDLYKAYGVRIIFTVAGTAGRFSFIPLLVAFGSGLGLLGLATVLADLLVTKVLERRHFYSRHKYEYVSDAQYNKDDDFEAIERTEQSRSTVERTPLLAAS